MRIPSATPAAADTASVYCGTLNSRLTSWDSNHHWLSAMPAAVASTSTGGLRNTNPSAITMSVTPIEKR